MATRTYCDNCGNLITGKANKFCYGPTQRQAYADDEYQAYADDEYDEEEEGKKSKIKRNAIRTIQVDLCDACTSVWMTRVGNLTKQSEPDA